MDWAKIEIEFPPSTHDPSEVMAFLEKHFRHESGVPTATITLVSIGGEPTDEDVAAIPLAIGMSWQTASGKPPSSIKAGALAICKAFPGQKIRAIKEMRASYGYGLKEAKDLIDVAWSQVYP